MLKDKLFKWCHNSLSKHAVLNDVKDMSTPLENMFKIVEESESILVHTIRYEYEYHTIQFIFP